MDTSENQRILLISILKVASSYVRNVEEPAGAVPDTIQYWLQPGRAWRIRTFALDHDIHIHALEKLPHAMQQYVEPFQQSTQHHYGDLLAATHVIEFDDFTDREEGFAKFHAAGLPAN